MLIVVALDAEARPLVDRWKLRRDHSQTVFPIYLSDKHKLIVSGVGKVMVATAAGYLAGLDSDSSPQIWLNFGIAGHKEMSVGSVRVAHTIYDEALNRHWYPPQNLLQGVSSHILTTVDQACEHYPTNSLYDMEATGFYPVASRFSTGEFCQVVKIVSDNSCSPLKNISKNSVGELISEALPTIVSITDKLEFAHAAYLQTVCDHHQTHSMLQLANSKFHFSATQQHELKSLTQGWAISQLSKNSFANIVQNNDKKTAFLQCLRLQLMSRPIHY